MKINLNRKDLEKFYHLLDIKEVNLEYSKMCLDFVNSNILTSYSDLTSLKNSFFNFLEINEKENKVFIDDYKIEFKKIIPNLVLNNPYYKNIKINPSTFQNLSFSHATYKQYQPFIYDDISIDETDYKEIIRLGYFEQEITYPTLNENNTTWMSLIPHEILTMEKPINAVKGNVLVLGLGMGYFAYMISNKEDVSSITIIENNLNLINFFNHHLLPQFENKQKIKIEFADALTYLGKTNENFEYITMSSGDEKNDANINNSASNTSSEKSSSNKESAFKISVVNINTATQTELETLPGIGPSLALKIINYRKQNGKFSSIEDIKNVSGIGDAKFENIKNYIRV